MSVSAKAPAWKTQAVSDRARVGSTQVIGEGPEADGPKIQDSTVLYPTGYSAGAMAVQKQIAQVANFDTTVLVLGESGTGKELVARQIHLFSGRTSAPFVPVNCGAIPADLLESELFGHERGAFTGAVTARQGRFEMAQGGTLFLDEIGEMSPHMQVKLLRVLQQKSFERVGSCETRTADVRIIAATHRDLEEEVREGRLREDLFFRLNVVPIQLPPLRERGQDLPELIEGFHAQLELRGHVPVKLTPSAVQALRGYEWPGNVRELQNLLERLSVMQPGEQVSAATLPDRYRPRGGGAESVSLPVDEPLDQALSSEDGGVDAPTSMQGPGNELRLDLPADGIALKDLLTSIERKLIQQALVRSGGVVSQAARLLGLGRTTLLEKIRKLQLN